VGEPIGKIDIKAEPCCRWRDDVQRAAVRCALSGLARHGKVMRMGRHFAPNGDGRQYRANSRYGLHYWINHLISLGNIRGRRSVEEEERLHGLLKSADA
jgi:hypothetical protein